MESREQIERQRRESEEVRRAQREGRSHSYIDTDGCEVTVTRTGHVFYNASDWW